MTLSELRAVCEKATPGPWENSGDHVTKPSSSDKMDGWVICDAKDCWDDRANIAFISTFHPARVMQLLEDYERMRVCMEEAILSGYIGYGRTKDAFSECLASLRLGKEGGENE